MRRPGLKPHLDYDLKLVAKRAIDKVFVIGSKHHFCLMIVENNLEAILPQTLKRCTQKSLSASPLPL
jgi:hypothetical protein